MKIENDCKIKPRLVNQFGQAVSLESNGRPTLIEEPAKDLTLAEEWKSMFGPGIIVTKPENIREFSWL